jgi:hypothetical protein
MRESVIKAPSVVRHFFETTDAKKGVISITDQGTGFYEWIAICGPKSRRGGATEKDDAFEDAMVWVMAEFGTIAESQAA